MTRSNPAPTTSEPCVPLAILADVIGEAFDMIKQGVVDIQTIENPLAALDTYIALKRVLGVIYGIADVLDRTGYEKAVNIAQRGGEFESKLDLLLMERSIADICTGRTAPSGPVNG